MARETWKSTFWNRAVIPLLALSMLGMDRCCTPPPPPPDLAPDAATAGPGLKIDPQNPLRVAPPAPEVRGRVKPNRTKLPPGWVADFPVFDGDSFFVTLPPSTSAALDAGDVATNVVRPVLEALGFEGGLARLAPPPQNGVPAPVANFARVSQQLRDLYSRKSRLGGVAGAKVALERIRTLPPRPRPSQEEQALTFEGLTPSQFVAQIERSEIAFPFRQVVTVGGQQQVPIEHAVVVAMAWEGQGITAVYGSVINQYSVANRDRLGGERIPRLAADALSRLARIDGEKPRRVSYEGIDGDKPVSGPAQLVALPYGGKGGVIELRLAYRVTLRATLRKRPVLAVAWIDAEDARLLKSEPLSGEIDGQGKTYSAAPGSELADTTFDVDAAQGGQYTLALGGVFDRLDVDGDFAYNTFEAVVGAGVGPPADFRKAAFVDEPFESKAGCAGSNALARQARTYAALHRYYSHSIGNGIYSPFPVTPWVPAVWNSNSYCGADASLGFGACDGFFAQNCPDATFSSSAQRSYLHFADDETAIAHEFAHGTVQRLGLNRPSNWCCAPAAACSPACTMPVGLYELHDLADAVADHWESNDCVGGWVAKNVNGVNANRNCAKHNEAAGLPRRHSVSTPFVPDQPGDHFPEHRQIAAIDAYGYADGQIAAAALWQLRLSMQGLSPLAGEMLFGARFTRALRRTGFVAVPIAENKTDLGIYRRLHELERWLMEEWASAGSSTGAPVYGIDGPRSTNKVTAAFARAGLFLVPAECLHPVASTNSDVCPIGISGADAVIDVDDNDPSDDTAIDNTTFPERDYIKKGEIPIFHVWTGPRYRFTGSDGTEFPNPAPCNREYNVELSNNAGFQDDPPNNKIRRESGWREVNRDPTDTSPDCYAAYQPDDIFTAVVAPAAGNPKKVYYRVTTKSDATGTERKSTKPGNGLRTVSPPFCVVTQSGRP